jgi:phage baseplate assembly protein W
MADNINSITIQNNIKVPFAYRRDLSWNLELDFNGDIKMVEDIEALNQSIYTILSSNFGDKPLEEFFGANISPLLFENASPPNFIQYEIQRRLTDAINKSEPSIVILNTKVDSSDITHNVIKVTIIYMLSDGITVGIFDENMSVFKSNT